MNTTAGPFAETGCLFWLWFSQLVVPLNEEPKEKWRSLMQLTHTQCWCVSIAYLLPSSHSQGRRAHTHTYTYTQVIRNRQMRHPLHAMMEQSPANTLTMHINTPDSWHTHYTAHHINLNTTHTSPKTQSPPQKFSQETHKQYICTPSHTLTTTSNTHPPITNEGKLLPLLTQPLPGRRLSEWGRQAYLVTGAVTKPPQHAVHMVNHSAVHMVTQQSNTQRKRNNTPSCSRTPVCHPQTQLTRAAAHAAEQRCEPSLTWPWPLWGRASSCPAPEPAMSPLLLSCDASTYNHRHESGVPSHRQEADNLVYMG